jgi:hypothetical protein
MFRLMVPQKIEIIRRLESGGSCSMITAPYNTGSSSLYEKRNRRINYDPLWHQVEVQRAA